MDNKNKRLSIRKEILADYEEKDFFSCCEKAEKIIKLYEETEKEPIEYCTDLYNLAFIQQNLGKFSISIKYYKKILKILEKKDYDINNKQDIKRLKFIIDIENSLGVCYTKSTVKQTFAINCFERALSIAKKYLNDDTQIKLNLLHNIGCSYYDIAQYDDAIYHFLEELSIRKTKDIDFVDNLNFLGYSYEKQKKYDDAIGYLLQAIDIVKGLTGLVSEEYISNSYYLASVYFKMGNYNMSIKTYEKICSLIEQRLGQKHPYVSETLTKLAESYLKTNQIEQALKIQLKALNIVKETVGEKHIFYASNLKRVGDIYYILDDYEKALFYYETENKIKKEVMGIYNEEYVNSLLNYINILIKNNNFEKQQQCSQTLLKMIDFDLPKKSYEKAILILCKIYIYNNMANELYNIYDYYRNVAKIDTFDDMVLKSKEIEEDIIQKENKLNAIFENYDDNTIEEDFTEDLKEDIFDGIKNLFDGIKKEIDKIGKNAQHKIENNDYTQTENIQNIENAETQNIKEENNQLNQKDDNDDDSLFI